MARKHMNGFLTKYLAGVGGVLLIFGNFVACGTQMYQVSVEEDLDTTRVAQANPEHDDPESTLYGIHATDGWKQTPIPFRFGAEMNEDQKVHLLAAIKKWEWAVGKKLFQLEGTHDAVDGDTFEDLYSSLEDDINGHYRDNDWSKTAKPDYVLATTIWNNGRRQSEITKADIRFNTQHYIIGDSLVLRANEDQEVVDMQSLALHEIGHLLGLAHVDEEVDSLSIMNPSLFIGEGLTSRELSRGDIERIQMIYGCNGHACNIDSLVADSETGSVTDTLTVTAKLWMEAGSGTSPEENLQAH